MGKQVFVLVAPKSSAIYFVAIAVISGIVSANQLCFISLFILTATVEALRLTVAVVSCSLYPVAVIAISVDLGVGPVVFIVIVEVASVIEEG